MTPSTMGTRSAASANTRKAGESRTITSYCCDISLIKDFILGLSNILAGLGGSGPLVSTYIPGIPDSCTIPSMLVCSVSKVLKPTWLDSPFILCCLGICKSQSTTITFFPDWANAIAKLNAIVDLPSPGSELVISRDLKALLF